MPKRVWPAPRFNRPRFRVAIAARRLISEATYNSIGLGHSAERCSVRQAAARRRDHPSPMTVPQKTPARISGPTAPSDGARTAATPPATPPNSRKHGTTTARGSGLPRFRSNNQTASAAKPTNPGAMRAAPTAVQEPCHPRNSARTAAAHSASANTVTERGSGRVRRGDCTTLSGFTGASSVSGTALQVHQALFRIASTDQAPAPKARRAIQPARMRKL